MTTGSEGPNRNPKPEPSAPEPAPVAPSIPRFGASNGAIGCVHKYVMIDSLADVAPVSQRLEGKLYVFACERCLHMATKGLRLGAKSES